jgi:hypothetical protein
MRMQNGVLEAAGSFTSTRRANSPVKPITEPMLELVMAARVEREKAFKNVKRVSGRLKSPA